MIEGLRRAEQGMLPRVTQQETLANNLANSLTPGFKRDRVTFQAVMQQAAATATPATLPGGPSYSTAAVSRPDMRPGALEETGNPLDLAIAGNAFFAVQTPAGERYTRAGNFTRNAQGELALPDGSRVLGGGGPISVDGAVAISGDGSVSVNGEPRAQLRLVKFADPSTLSHEGNALWKSSAPPVPAGLDVSVKQGFIEGSNVNPVEEMVEMMNAFRSYEANLRGAQIQGDSLSSLISSASKR